MKKYAVLLIGFSLCCAIRVQAQLSPYYDYQQLYFDAVELFEKEKYGAAEKKIEAFLEAEESLRSNEENDLHTNGRYMQAVSAYFLERSDAVALLEGFTHDFDENTKTMLARYYLGKYYFDRKDYDQAIEPFLLSHQSGGLDLERSEEVVFLLGYSYFMEDNDAQSIRFFELAGKRPGKYQEDAQYYRSILYYKGKKYEEAYLAFQDLQESQKYGKEIRVYLANTLLKLKRYDELYVLADELISGPRVQGKDAQIYYIVANASFERDDFPRTTEYFQRYVKSRGRMNRTDYFRYGYSHYKQDQFKDAIPVFERALSKDDSVSQVASYYLGFCFLEENDEPSAKFAFERAAKITRFGNPEIVEDALYQYAKVSFSTEDYDEALRALTMYNDRYPNSPNTDEVQTMIGESYLYTRNYPRSIQYFESVPRTTFRAKKAYQTVCYFYGLELFERPAYRKADVYFLKASENDVDKTMGQSATYWYGESQFRQGNFTEAKAAYNSFLRSPNVSKNEFYADGYYGLGWADFKQKNYTGALQGFEDFIAKGGRKANKDKIIDAHLRAGDCLFLKRQYSNANNYYSRVVDFRYTYRDYALYQLGESYYRQNNYQASVKQFANLIQGFKQSELRDNALDRISEIYATWIKDYAKATQYGKMLVNDYPKSPLAGDAYNRMALAAYNSGDSNSAIKYFKKVLTDYSGDRKNAQIALDNLSSLLPENEFDRVFKDYRNNNPQMDNNLADLAFNTGKDRFFSMNYRSAIEQFTIYINDFRNGPNYHEALLFRARSYKELGQYAQAFNDYRTAYSGTVTNEFTNVALLEAAELKFEQEDFISSLELYQTLDGIAGKLQNRVQAKFGIAKSYKAMGDYSQAQNALEDIAFNNEVAVYSRSKASVEIGHCQYLRGDLSSALTTFKDIENESKNAFGAESQYMITQIIFDQGLALKNSGRVDDANLKFEEVKTQTIYMKNNFPSFNELKARTFLIAAEAYYELGNVFQAKGTLQSLIGEDRFPDIQQAARDRLAEIEAEETKADNFSPAIEDGGK